MSVDLAGRFVLCRHADLKARGGESILVLPERAIRLGGSGGEILELCLSPRSGREIVDTLGRRYPGAEGLEAEVAGFLREMLALGGLERATDGEEAGR